MAMEKMSCCPDCNATPGNMHEPGCDVERCSVCGGQYVSCECPGHDRAFAHWTGIWPGRAEAVYLGLPSLNDLYIGGFHNIFFVKPTIKERK